MLYYPQLSTGAVAQFPLRRTTLTRTLVNELADGSTLRLADADAYGYRWELRYEGLSGEERLQLEEFFKAAEGRLSTFTFLDPYGNLLRWSEDLDNPVWRNDGMIAIAATDQFREGGRVLRVTNSGQISQGLEQTVSIPSSMTLCLSAIVRCTSAAEVTCSLASNDGELTTSWTVGPAWKQIWCAGAIAGDAEELRARFELNAGATVELCCMHLAAQPLPGSYKRTTDVNGVFRSARFDSDRMEFHAHGINDHSTIVYLRSGHGGQ